MRFLTGVLGLSLLGVVFPSQAATGTAESTSNATSGGAFHAAVLFDNAALSERTLPNGVRGIVREARGNGLVCVQAWVKAGGRYESDANSGAARVLAEAGLRASQNYPRRTDVGGNISGGPREALENLGGDVKFLTARDSTFISATVAAQFLPQALRALSDGLLRPDLSDNNLADARLDASSEQRRRETDALDSLSDIAFKLAFAKHPYRKPAGGTSLSVEAMTASQVRTYHQARYVGPNISIVVVGDTKAATAHDLISRFFGDARRSGEATPSIAPESSPPEFRSFSRRFLTKNKIVALGFRAPGLDNPTDVVATDVLLSHWKEGNGARLRQLLLGPDTEDNAAPGTDAPALGFDVDYLTQRDPGLMTITLVVNPNARGSQAVGIVMDEIEKLRTQGITDEELARAKKALVAQYIQQSDSVSGQAGALGFYEMIADYKFATSYLDRIGHITSADVKRVAEKYLSRTSYVQVTAEPPPAAKPSPPDGPRDGSSGSITASLNLKVR